MTDLKTLVEQEMERAGSPPYTIGDLVELRDRERRNERITAGVAGIAVFVAAVWIVTTGGPLDRSPTPAIPGGSGTGPTGAPEPDAEGIIGLPPKGAMPSAREASELVLQLEGSTGAGFHMIWVYADGRMIWHRWPETLPDLSVGLLEQHLTPEGVEFLRSNALSTGLFEHDLDLVREDDAPLLSIGVRDGDRLVRVTWARRSALGQDADPAEATPGQVTALVSLHALITDPASWPASAWEDQEIREYVPATYAICSRGFPRPVDPTRVLTLMPEEARNLLGSDFGLRWPRDCAEVTTEDAHTLAEILDAAGVVRVDPSPTGFWLRYLLADPQDAGNEIWIDFQPVLPHGGSTWLGPG